MKIFIRIISIACILAVIFAGVWALINYVFIPRIVIPKVRTYLDTTINSSVKIAIKDIYFHPFSGFQLEGVKLYGPVVVKNDYILSAKLVDLDIAFLPLLRKRVEIKRFEMSDVDLNIGRDTQGTWNLAPLFALALTKGLDDFDIVIKEFKVEKGSIDFADHLHKDNVLERRFTNVNLLFTNTNRELYRLTLSGGAQNRTEESIDMRLDYNDVNKSLEGSIELNTSHLEEYWHYYLDELLRPWHLKAKSVVTQTHFSYQNDILYLDGKYTIDDGILRYGDLSIQSDAVVKSKLRYVKGVADKSVAKIDVFLKEASSHVGEHGFLGQGECTAVVTEKTIIIEKLYGLIENQPVLLHGDFAFTNPQALHLAGTIGAADNDFHLKILPDDKGEADWRIKLKDSYVNLRANVTNLKNMAFDLAVDSDIHLPDLSGFQPMIEKRNIKGAVGVSGNIKGEVDKPQLCHGAVDVKARNLSVLNSEPLSFDFNMVSKEGVFAGHIPKTTFYDGELSGEVKSDLKRWGLEANVGKCNLEKFSKISPKLDGIKGIFSGTIACAGSVHDAADIQGGGYFRFIECDLRSAPLFLNTEKGISSVSKDFKMPVFQRVEGNFGIRNKAVEVENMLARSTALRLGINGTYSFSGDTDFDVGVRPMGNDILRTTRQILVPATIGIDFLVSTIHVKINGKWPNLKETTDIRPMAELMKIFAFEDRADPDKYSLKKLWQEGAL